jgi:MFS family permease
MSNISSILIRPDLREQSLRAAIINGVCWAVMFGAGESSFPLFAAAIQAPDFFFGLMVGVPSLAGPLFQVFGANLLERVRNRRRLVLAVVGIQIVGLWPLALIPLLEPGALVYAIFCSAMLLYYVCMNLCTPAWTAWISVLVPSERRMSFFARFSRNIAAMSLISKLLVGGALFWAGCRAGDESAQAVAYVFAGAFAVAALSRMAGFTYIQRMYEPAYEDRADSYFTFWQFIRRARESNFVHFVLCVSFIVFGTFISAPFFVPYALYSLQWPQWQWVAIDSMGVLSSVITLLYWGRFSQRFGNKLTMQYTSYGIALIPLLWLSSTNFWYLMVVTFFSGAAWAGFNLSSYNYILEAVSPPKRARCMAYFAIFIGVGSFLGSMAGTWLNYVLPPAEWSAVPASNFAYLLVLSGVVRVAGGLVFLPTFRELRQVQPLALTQYFFYVARARFPVGLLFDTIINGHDEEEKPAEAPAEPREEAVEER